MMKQFIYMFLLLVCIGNLYAFQRPFSSVNSLKASSRFVFTENKPFLPTKSHSYQRFQSSLNVVVDEREVLADVIQPAKIDTRAIFLTLAGQGLLLNLAFLLGNFLNIDVLDLKDLETEAEILRDTFEPSLIIAGIVIATGFALRNTKLQGLQQFFRERKFYVLRVLGLQSTVVQAAIIATIISFGEAFSDEVFFRGLCFSSIHQQFGDNVAIGVSSLIYGLAHYPIFGSNIFVESFLGLIYGESFLSSNFNIIVPVIIHAIYSLVSMYVTWYFGTLDLRQRIANASKNVSTKVDDVQKKFEAIAKAIFEIIDLDQSGQIDAKELKLGLRLFGFSPDVLDEKKVKGTNYDVILKLSQSGEKGISSDKFVSILKEGLATWPRFDETTDYWKK